jgi:hypothetical protein
MVKKMIMKRTQDTIALLLAGIAVMALGTSTCKAQYFESLPEHSERRVVRASGLDSLIVMRTTPFDLPATPDSVKFMYHEPMPDSIMPRSAVVIGMVMMQFEDPDELVERLEKYARKSGADWIVSFQEPHAVLTKNRMKVYRSSAVLIHVLDPQFINQSDISYSYYEQTNLHNYAAVNDWFGMYGKHFGSK